MTSALVFTASRSNFVKVRILLYNSATVVPSFLESFVRCTVSLWHFWLTFFLFFFTTRVDCHDWSIFTYIYVKMRVDALGSVLWDLDDEMSYLSTFFPQNSMMLIGLLCQLKWAVLDRRFIGLQVYIKCLPTFTQCHLAVFRIADWRLSEDTSFHCRFRTQVASVT